MSEIPPRPEELLENVRDRESFMAFIRALVADRERAEELERQQPTIHDTGIAGEWQNSSISAYLGAAESYFEDSGGCRFKPADLA